MAVKRGHQPRCQLASCNTAIKPGRLMCPTHWAQVPLPLQKAVWATYKRGEGVRTHEYVDAARDAIASVQGA